MPLLRTMDVLVLACQQQVDLENHTVISTAEWKGFISRAYGELYTIVYESGMRHFETASTITTGGTNVLTTVTDHLSTVTVSYVVDATSGRLVDLRELMAQEQSPSTGASGSSARYFALVDNQVLLYPTPPAGQSYVMRYVRQPTDLSSSAGSDTVDVVTPDGLDFLIWSVAVRAMAKTEADPQLAISEREQARVRLKESAQLRAMNAPRRRVVSFDFDEMDRYDW